MEERPAGALPGQNYPKQSFAVGSWKQPYFGSGLRWGLCYGEVSEVP